MGIDSADQEQRAQHSDGPQPDASQPDASQPDAPHSDAREPDAREHDAPWWDPDAPEPIEPWLEHSWFEHPWLPESWRHERWPPAWAAPPAVPPALAARRQKVLAELGRAVLQLRLAYGWSQSEVEHRSGVDQTTISRLERGRQPGLSIQALVAILEP